MIYCKQCLEKQQRINELEEEIAILKVRLRHQERTAKEGFFGSSTPSSKVPVKSNSSPKLQHHQDGGKTGHKGYGRQQIYAEDADSVERITLGNTCPDCGTVLEQKGSRTRTVIDCQPIRIKNKIQSSCFRQIYHFCSLNSLVFSVRLAENAGGFRPGRT